MFGSHPPGEHMAFFSGGSKSLQNSQSVLLKFTTHPYQSHFCSAKSYRISRNPVKSHFSWENIRIKSLVGGVNTLEKYESQLGLLFPTEWTNRKCSKPPTGNELPSGKRLQKTVGNHHVYWENPLFGRTSP